MAPVGLLLGILSGAVAVGVVQEPPSLSLSVGETALMACTIQGAPSNWIQFIYWKLNGSDAPLQNDSRISITRGPGGHTSSLLILSVRPKDSGTYVCEALGLAQGKQVLYSGTGTPLLISNVAPVLHLREEPGGQLVCEAQRFYPPELNISWNFSAGANPAQETRNETLKENPDGTYTKTSIVTITEGLWGTEVICQVHHMTLPRPLPLRLYLPSPRVQLYHWLFPVRVILAAALIIGFCVAHFACR
ncbi:hypothetical protein XENTR_v10004657 [Xenopus tropicalis]|uniref:Ig-like domain-containing protein n=1 Tax=Xenopus tropicalis TaxID=8364 RepID=A0A803JLS5_XENTR|nr:hypothetical protein XENTR_v10004657 [Xenopus tropicalis]